MPPDHLSLTFIRNNTKTKQEITFDFLIKNLVNFFWYFRVVVFLNLTFLVPLSARKVVIDAMITQMQIQSKNWIPKKEDKSIYCTCAIITRSLYIFHPIFESQKHFLRSFFRKILILCMVSTQEQFQIKSGL